MNIEEFLKTNRLAFFDRFEDNKFYYIIENFTEDKGNKNPDNLYELSIPLSEVKSLKLGSVMQTFKLSKWIDKAIKAQSFFKIKRTMIVN